MNTKSSAEDRIFLLNEIKDKVLHFGEVTGVPIFNKGGDTPTWLLDFRRGFSYPAFLEAVARLFWSEFNIQNRWQIGGMESASLPLVTALALTGTDVRSFYIRKSRKKQGLVKQIEGDIDSTRDIILVDDLMNSGSSLVKQIEVLERELGLSVKAVFCIVQFRNLEAYKEISDRGIEIKSLFNLSDLGLILNTQKFKRIRLEDSLWQFRARKAHLFSQGSKNIPLLFRDAVIQTLDDGTITQFDQATGKVRWHRRVMFEPRVEVKPFVCSSILDTTLYVTTYRGGLLALDAQTGTPRFKLPIEHSFTNAFVLSSDTLITGVSRGRGWNSYALMSVDLKTQEVRPLIDTKQAVVGAMVIDEKRGLVVVADTANTIYCVTLQGHVKWVRDCEGTNMSGVGTNEFGDVVVMNSQGVTMVLHVETGKTVDSFTLPEFHAAPPLLKGRFFYGATLGRCVYRYNYFEHTTDWLYETDGRMYSAPVMVGTSLMVGDNNGRVYMLDEKTGKLLAQAVTPERVTNPIVITPTCILISTFVNDLYMLKREVSEVLPAVHGPNHQATNLDSTHRV